MRETAAEGRHRIDNSELETIHLQLRDPDRRQVGQSFLRELAGEETGQNLPTLPRRTVVAVRALSNFEAPSDAEVSLRLVAAVVSADDLNRNARGAHLHVGERQGKIADLLLAVRQIRHLRRRDETTLIEYLQADIVETVDQKSRIERPQDTPNHRRPAAADRRKALLPRG